MYLNHLVRITKEYIQTMYCPM